MTRRLRNQLLARSTAKTPHEVVRHLGAVQAQDYLGALWAVGQRMAGGNEQDVERALAERSIVRTWPLRGTLHFVAAEDVRWMLALLGERVLRKHAPRLKREFGITEAVLRRSRKTVTNALRGGAQLTRPELYAILANPHAGLHILWHLAHESLICFGPRRGKQQTFVLLDEWVPPSEPISEERALAELARRYFLGHGPATAADFAWWSGLPATIARNAIESAAPALEQEEDYAIDPRVHLLPPYDEFTVGYRDREAVLDPAFRASMKAGAEIFQAVVVVNGVVCGTWKRALDRDRVRVTTSMARSLKRNEQRALDAAIERYAAYLNFGSTPRFRIRKA
ncbi:MAG TPA: winged helix DNA-binding domain-containing protein [Thermoanaerobaculia bacterium]|nr:winged helix DNA-binding domain-containing protein [Thermoanaerobaculia bacterium]